MYKINLLGQKDAIEFCSAADNIPHNVYLVGENHNYRVNAKSIMGCMLAMSEWGGDIWVESAVDCYSIFEKWIETSVNDGNYIHK